MIYGCARLSKTFENGHPVGFMILKQDQAELPLTRSPIIERGQVQRLRICCSTMRRPLHEICVVHGLRIILGLQDMDYGLRAVVFEDLDGQPLDVGSRSVDSGSIGDIFALGRSGDRRSA